MLYLTGQILLVVVFATFVGLGLGWWSRGLMADVRQETLPESTDSDPFSARSRLEQCHRDNAELRRELKEAQEQCEQLRRAGEIKEEDDLIERLHAAEQRADALMEDLQLRDDTIAVLENELEQLR